MHSKSISIFLLPLLALGAAVVLTGCAGHHSNSTSGEERFQPLFNGKDLTGWTYSNKKIGQGYQVDPDAQTLYCTKTDGGNLVTEKEYANFVLRFEFKLEPGANNGIGIRAPLSGRPTYDGLEIQILDDTSAQYAGKLEPTQYHGSVYKLFAAKQGSLKPVGEWNKQEITVDGPQIIVKLNGQTIVDGNLDDIKDPATRAKHPGIERQTGHIVLLGHGTRVDFRNLGVKELK